MLEFGKPCVERNDIDLPHEGQVATKPTGDSRCFDALVPVAFDVREFQDPVERNCAITGWYREIDKAMQSYLGDPPLPSWATFGQHASNSAGLQMQSLKEALTTFRELREAWTALKEGSPLQPKSWLRFFKEAAEAAGEAIRLIAKDGAVSQGLRLAYCKLSRPLTEFFINCDSVQEIWGALTNKAQFLELAGHLGELAGACVMLPSRINDATAKVLDVMVTGNTVIFEAMAPNLSGFLEAAKKGEEDDFLAEPLPSDPRGFMAAALSIYREVRLLSMLAKEYDSGSVEVQKIQEERVALVKRANLLMVFGEQAVRVQPLYDGIREELGVMSGQMTIVDPSGVYPLLPEHPMGNWADLYTRMGIDPTYAPTDPSTITPDNFPPLLDRDDCRFRGTIAEYFLRPFKFDGGCKQNIEMSAVGLN